MIIASLMTIGVLRFGKHSSDKEPMSASTTPSVVVLGANGMLGSMVAHYLQHQTQFKVITTTRRSNEKNATTFDALDFLHHPEKYSFLHEADYVINCIGIIKPHCHDDNPDQVWSAIQVNAAFPHHLARTLATRKTKILQIATDCVYSGTKGKYSEPDLHDALDVYGKTKSLGEGQYDNLLNIRSSIIGPEQGTSLSLLEWFLHQPKEAELKGFQHHVWNGVTTLQFAQLCASIIDSNSFTELRKTSHLHHFVPNSTVTKFELLSLFQKIFKTQYQIEEVTAQTSTVPAVDRTLATKLHHLEKLMPANSMEKALSDLRSYMETYHLSHYEQN